MALRDLLKKKAVESVHVHENRKDNAPLSIPRTMPETIDFAALWAEPSEGGGLLAIVPLITLGLVVVLFVMKLTGH